ncbi:hypothetical protein NB721_000619 [Xanthomonas sacchari]|nr:hypothetical protein [Xanthomonas sacchari]
MTELVGFLACTSLESSVGQHQADMRRARRVRQREDGVADAATRVK